MPGVVKEPDGFVLPQSRAIVRDRAQHLGAVGVDQKHRLKPHLAQLLRHRRGVSGRIGQRRSRVIAVANDKRKARRIAVVFGGLAALSLGIVVLGSGAKIAPQR